MNAPNPNAGERDFDALRRAQRAHEPSMEEILASIRSIIADDREPGSKPAPKPPIAPQGPQIVYSKDAPATRPAAESPARVEPTQAAMIEPVAPKVVWRQPETELAAPSEPEAEGSFAAELDSLLAAEDDDRA